MEYEIIDNALDVRVAQSIKQAMTSQAFPWFYSDGVAGKGMNGIDQFYFTHLFYSDGMFNSQFSEKIIGPLSQVISARAFIRVKGNFYPRSDSVIENPPHYDFDFPHHGAIYYVNSNDGFTVLEDGTKIKSVENRILLFDPSTPHHSTNCTNQHGRININFNFF
jgi:hypothetical protein